jgi:hypothetical protein
MRSTDLAKRAEIALIKVTTAVNKKTGANAS